MMCLIKRIAGVLAVSVMLAGCASTSAAPIPTGVPVLRVVTPTSAPAAPEVSALASTAVPPTSIPIGQTLSDVVYTLPLTIRHVTKDQVFVYFELSRPIEGVVVVRQANNASVVVAAQPFDAQTAAHSMVLDGLSSDTAYEVMVGAADGKGGYDQPAYVQKPWGPVTFRTPAEREPLRVAVIGDAGMGEETTAQLAQQMAAAQPDFVIFVGDTVYKIPENRDAYQAFEQKYYLPFAPLLQTMPIYNAVGNHDVESATIFEGLPFYYRAFPPFVDPRFDPSDNGGRNQWYAFAYGKIQFLMLDTQTFYNEEGNDQQLKWLKDRLADQRFAYTIPAFHIPPYTSGLHTGDGIPVQKNWVPLFEQAHVPLVLSGHDHNYQRLQSHGVTYLVSGGGSASLYPPTIKLPESQVFAQRSHFVILEFYADRIEVRSIALGGEILDQATIPIPH